MSAFLDLLAWRFAGRCTIQHGRSVTRPDHNPTSPLRGLRRGTSKALPKP
jgi:hypothetical protein